jgi:hypothetical protein
MKVLRSHAIRVLHAGLPLQSETLGPLGCTPFIGLKSTPGLYIDLANVAQQYQLRAILPIALALVASHTRVLTVESVMGGVLREDGTRATLSPANLQLFWPGIFQLVKACQTSMFDWEQECSNDKPECMTANLTFLAHAARSTWCLPDVFSDLSTYWLGDMCDECSDSISYSYDKGRKEVWQNLPAMFGVDLSWDEL